ncbi:MAG TPA: endonuclease domain-containing protein [Streptosporangiaceae bacterium]|nr:endonuclease domain-containing protein [Streptosporangiaceae bacterium]
MNEPNPDADARKKERQREYMRQYRKANRAKLNERARQYRAANLEKAREADRQYAAANRDKRRERGRQYYAENRDELRARQRSWREANGDYIRESSRRYYAENREKILERTRRYHEVNRDKRREWSRRYQQVNRAAVRQYGLKYAHGLDEGARSAMWQEQGRRCYLCGDALELAAVRVEHWHGCPGHSPKRSCPDCRRGLACHQCNVIIGLAGEDPAMLRRIADNLERANIDVAARQAAMPQHITLF